MSADRKPGPLPKPEHQAESDDCTYACPEGYSAEQMYAYAAQEVAAALAAAPAAPAAEPVAWVRQDWNGTGRRELVFNEDKPTAASVRDEVVRPKWTALYAAPGAAPAQSREPLTDEQMLACVRSVGVPVPMGLTRDRGPYEVTEPSWLLIQLVRAIERAHGIGSQP